MLKSFFTVGLWLSLCIAMQAQESNALLKLEKIIPLENVKGRIDHMAVDVAGQRLFVAALGNNTVEVMDLKAGKKIRSLSGFSEPQGIVYVPDLNRIFVANGGAGTVNALDGISFELLKSLGDMPDADDARFDARAGLVYIAYGDGALAEIRAAKMEKVGDIKTDAHPEAFELELGGDRIFINVPDAREIETADRQRQKVVAKWPIEKFQGNFPMALDEKDHRLFVGCRHPDRLLVLDTVTGGEITNVTLSGDNDDLFYDPTRRLIYASCGEGFVDVFSQQDANHYERIAHIPTARGARTSLFVPELKMLCLAVPRRGKQTAAVWTYKTNQ